MYDPMFCHVIILTVLYGGRIRAIKSVQWPITIGRPSSNPVMEVFSLSHHVLSTQTHIIFIPRALSPGVISRGRRAVPSHESSSVGKKAWGPPHVFRSQLFTQHRKNFAFAGLEKHCSKNIRYPSTSYWTLNCNKYWIFLLPNIIRKPTIELWLLMCVKKALFSKVTAISSDTPSKSQYL
jgi:hypothetical protein